MSTIQQPNALAVGVPVVSDFDPLETGADWLARYRLLLAGAGARRPESQRTAPNPGVNGPD